MNEKNTSRVVSVVALDGHDERTILGLAAGLARHLEPLLAIPAATPAGREVVIGVASQGDWPERLRKHGEEVFFIAIDGRTAGFLGVIGAGSQTSDFMEDEMRDSSRSTVVDLADGETFDLRIAPVLKQIGDASVRMLAYNGSVPGPALRVRQGSELLVNVFNEGDLDATVHWHGLRLDNRYDGTTLTQRPIPVGGSFTYRLTFPDPGVYWYHPHIREDYGQEMGLYGNIIVVPADEEYWPRANREIALTLDDLLLENGSVAPFDKSSPTFTAMGRFGNVMLVNGEVDPSFRTLRGEVVRLYLTNTANTRVFNVGLRGARMKLVGGDSGRYERETFVDGVVIAPSERVVVDVLFDRPGQVTLEHRTPNKIYALAGVTVGDEQAEPSFAPEFEQLRVNSDLADARERMAGYLEAQPDKTLSLIAEMDMGGTATAFACPMHPEVRSELPDRCPKCGMKLVPAQLVGHASHGDHEHGHAAADPEPAGFEVPPGIEWEDDMLEVNRITNPTNMRWKLVDRQTEAEGPSIDWRFRVGDQVKIRLINEMDSDHPMQHPFHIHGAGRFLILARDGAAEPNLVWKDTVLVPTGQTVDVLLDVTHPGMWMAHCHIAEHHESGMMLSFRVDGAAS